MYPPAQWSELELLAALVRRENPALGQLLLLSALTRLLLGSQLPLLGYEPALSEQSLNALLSTLAVLSRRVAWLGALVLCVSVRMRWPAYGP